MSRFLDLINGKPADAPVPAPSPTPTVKKVESKKEVVVEGTKKETTSVEKN